MYGNLFIKTNAQTDLRSFAAIAFGLLDVASVAVRESDNYATGEYIVGQALSVQVEIAVADESDFPDYQFWITFQAHKIWTERPSCFDGLADLVAKRLALEGYEVARALAYGRVGGPKILYTRKSSSGTPRDQLEIIHVNATESE